jgi:DNA-binding transcriptional ArsR family regulator
MTSLSSSASEIPPEIPPMNQADANVAPLAFLLGDPARAAMLWAVSDGRAIPAGDLCRIARVTPSAGSAHLTKLVAGRLLVAERHGRHRYYRLAAPGIVRVLEALAVMSEPRAAVSLKEAHAASAIRFARTCYDHLAGRLGVEITCALVEQRALVPSGREYIVTDAGILRFAALGIDVNTIQAAARRTRRLLARACPDWSERRDHLAGALGAALATRLLDLEWLARMPATRALRVTNEGRRALNREFGVRLV